MLTRRKMLSRASLGALGLSAGGGLAFLAQNQATGAGTGDMVTKNAQAAIDSGLSYLEHRSAGGMFGEGEYRGNVAVTSLAGLAFLSNGSQPGRGKYGKLLAKTVDYLLDQSRPYRHFKGFLHNPAASPHGPMYEHGFGTLFLAEIYGMVHQKELQGRVHTALANAVDLIIRSQNREGGWRYKPDSSDADISVTICQIMALRAARNAGFAVPKRIVDKCVDYVKRCQDRISGGFRYQAQRRGGFGMRNRAFARTAAGVCALYSAGIYKGPEVEKGLEFLMGHLPTGRHFGPADMQYFYGHYYAAQAAWTAGGAKWAKWFPAIRDELVRSQRGNGSWDDRLDDHYGTAMACIILQIPNNYLPILQK